MPSEIFYWLLNMSLSVAVFGVFVLIIRTIKKIPRRIFVWLWFIPFLRMIIPFSIGVRFSLLNLISGTTSLIKTVNSSFSDLLVQYNSLQFARSYHPFEFKSERYESAFFTFSIVWITVTVILLIVLFTTYFSVLKDAANAKKYKDNIFLSDVFLSPTVVGIIRPRIIIPYSYLGKNLDLVFAHEKMHIRYADNLWKLAAFTIVCFHWFNPFSWLFLKLMVNDIELACDERVLSYYEDEKKKEYGNVLIDCVSINNVGGKGMKRRLVNIMSYERLTSVSALCYVTIVTVLFLILLFN